MKVTGVVAEYNPFHKGHRYHLQKARQETGADKIVVVMSGDFTQRGTPAIIDKYERTRMALQNGADLVVELPSAFACSSAEHFASGAMSVMMSLGVVDSVCFGSEAGSVDDLYPIAEVLSEESEEFKTILKNELKNGKTYPRARNQALLHCLPGFAQRQDLIVAPNNILGIEYIKSLIRMHSTIRPVAIRRTNSDYHSYRLDQGFASSQALRQTIRSAEMRPENFRDVIERVRMQVPEDVYEILFERFGNRYPIFPNDLSTMLVYKLLLERSHGYTSFADVSDDLSDKLVKVTNKAYTFEQFCDHLKSKDVTYARISRILCHILLNVRSADMDRYKENGNVFYTRVLGFREDAQDLLAQIQKKSKKPIITRVSEGDRLKEEIARRQFDRDVLATHIYESIVADKFGAGLLSEYERQIIKI
ncbi:MAG: nucleotidyltransferase [Lachnospiraceae bacterium]|nr:nucleotidyltransferase [Lachnospiraceae bacterium]